ncbi:hypothetical protein BS50DRAFT_155470 [Corynespora cassiicola Philippines]|uniref:Uncharacterized protein n=1 Tax=Corynespora cassiicola Philippines TaxID=1448308 RepID=A0A2T2N812_CORCC|nr:hypothetical protein BS50DRAFT_155470 [Corynespora cassiicola Philippines]
MSSSPVITSHGRDVVSPAQVPRCVSRHVTGEAKSFLGTNLAVPHMFIIDPSLSTPHTTPCSSAYDHTHVPNLRHVLGYTTIPEFNGPRIFGYFCVQAPTHYHLRIRQTSVDIGDSTSYGRKRNAYLVNNRARLDVYETDIVYPRIHPLNGTESGAGIECAMLVTRSGAEHVILQDSTWSPASHRLNPSIFILRVLEEAPMFFLSTTQNINYDALLDHSKCTFFQIHAAGAAPIRP